MASLDRRAAVAWRAASFSFRIGMNAASRNRLVSQLTAPTASEVLPVCLGSFSERTRPSM